MGFEGAIEGLRVLIVLRVCEGIEGFEGFNCDIIYGIICALSKVEECPLLPPPPQL